MLKLFLSSNLSLFLSIGLLHLYDKIIYLRIKIFFLHRGTQTVFLGSLSQQEHFIIWPDQSAVHPAVSSSAENNSWPWLPSGSGRWSTAPEVTEVRENVTQIIDMYTRTTKWIMIAGFLHCTNIEIESKFVR